jgi:hypothetical protein
MAALVAELSSQAEITEYRLNRPTSRMSLDVRGNQWSAPSSRVVDQTGMSGQVSGSTDSSPRPKANMFSFPAPNDSRDIGAATADRQLARQRAEKSRELESVQADATRKSTARQGLALELQEKSEFGIDRSAAAVSESLVQRSAGDGLPANEVRLDLADRELQNLQRYLARPNQPSEHRSFLLWIRTPERAQQAQQGDALPSSRNEPDDADQR